MVEKTKKRVVKVDKKHSTSSKRKFRISVALGLFLILAFHFYSKQKKITFDGSSANFFISKRRYMVNISEYR